jgi:hypothetical protein
MGRSVLAGKSRRARNEYPLVFRGDAYGVKLAIGDRIYRLEAYEVDGVFYAEDDEEGTSVTLRCDYAS